MTTLLLFLAFGIALPVCLLVWALTIPVLVFVYRAWRDAE